MNVGSVDVSMQDSHKSFLIKDLLGDVLRPAVKPAAGTNITSTFIQRSFATSPPQFD